MAAERMKKVTNLLTCVVCYEMYKKPKYLSCHHSYCEECIVRLLKESKIICPECRETSDAPPGGVKDLPNSFFINHLMDEVTLKRKVDGEEKVTCDMCFEEALAVALCPECAVFLCDHCSEYHKRSKEYRNHNMIPLNELQSKKKEVNLRPKPKQMLCQDHDLELNFFCETCDHLICHYCTTNEHNGHVHNSVKKMANKHRKELEKIIEPVEKMIVNLSALRQTVAANGEEMGTQTTKVDQQIDLYYEELHQQLQQQREELKKKLQEMSTQKKKAISLQLEQMEYTQAQLESVKELNDAVTNGSDQEALFAKKQVSNDVKRITECYNKLHTNRVELATIEFIPVKEYKESFPQFGQLYDEHVAMPGNCEVTDIPFKPLVGNKAEFKIITKNINSIYCSKGGSHIIAQLQSRRGDVVPVEVKDNKDGSYSASFVANQAGVVKLSVTIDGQHIKGSPYSVMLCQDYKSVGKPLKMINDGENMGYSWAIAFGKDGVWAVTDCTYHCVYVFDGQDQLIRKFGSSGSGNGQFSNPQGLAFDANNDLYVSDGFHRVQKFTINCEYLLQFGRRGPGNGQLYNPHGMTVHNNRLYIAEYNNRRISVFQLNGQFCSIIRSGQLKYPYDVTVSANGYLLVANYNCISSFTLDGAYVGRFDNGQLSNPIGLTTDMHGFVLVTENGNHRVTVFDKDGVHICSFGSCGSALGQFSDPRGIAVSPNGNIYIAEYSNKRVQIF